jgi:putative glutamine amidotransferase
MRLPDDAPIIAVPMCVKFLLGQSFHTVGEKYLTAIIEGSGGYPLSFPALGPVIAPEALLASVDGVLFTGSPSNVAVHHYDGRPDRPDSPQDPGRDAITLPLIRAAVAAEVPVLCICRGFQELNVALGGTLDTHVHVADGRLDHRAPENASYDDIYRQRHTIAIEPHGTFERILGKRETTVNSVHWQGIERLASGLKIEARAPDGVIEGVSLAAGGGFCLGVQWHPEYRATENADSMAIFRAFGEAARARRQRRLGQASERHAKVIENTNSRPSAA